MAGLAVAQEVLPNVQVMESLCEDGDAQSCLKLGDAWHLRRGVERWDDVRAVAAYEKGCALGSQLSCARLAHRLQYGEGIQADRARALTLYLGACDAGIPYACTGLGTLYERGWEVDKDLELGVAFYKKSCEQGDARGCSALGASYLDGDGVGLPQP